MTINRASVAEQKRNGTGGKFGAKTSSAPSSALSSPLASMAPSDIDVELEKLYETRAQILGMIEAHQKTLDRAAVKPTRYSEGQARRARAAIEECEEALHANELEIQPYKDEYARRPWPRAFFVQASGGHVHKSMSCSTCRPSTKFVWLTDYSGKTEDEIVDAAGETACTVCYPDAPVDALRKPRSFRIADDEERDARAKRQAEKSATKAAKAITTPDGEPLKLAGQWGETIKTEAAAKTELNRALEALWIHENYSPSANTDYVAERTEDARRLVDALAHKQQRTVEEVKAEHWAKVSKKMRREFAD